jgi:hypothetical protein
MDLEDEGFLVRRHVEPSTAAACLPEPLPVRVCVLTTVRLSEEARLG